MTNARLITLAAIAATTLAGCNYVPFTPEKRIADAKAKIEIAAKNPTTIKWGEVKEHAGTVCGVFNEDIGYAGSPEWTGAQHFVTVEGQPYVVDQYSDCEKGIAPFSRCDTGGDEAKVKADVESCKAFQATAQQELVDQMDEFFKSSGLVQSGSFDRDAKTWDERQKQSEKSPQGMDRKELSDRVDAWKVWDRAYNASMRKLPANSTRDQKIAAAAGAVVEANAATEAFLTQQGYR